MEQQESLITTQQRETFFITLYKRVFPSVAKYISRKGGTFDDAKDVFQDSVIIYYEKVINASNNCKNEQAYLMGIAKHLWLKKFSNKQEQHLDKEQLHNFFVNETKKPLTRKLLYYLETAGERCMRLLMAFYYDHTSLQDVARLFGYSSEHSAAVQKYKCLEKVRDTVKEKSLHYEDFLE